MAHHRDRIVLYEDNVKSGGAVEAAAALATPGSPNERASNPIQEEVAGVGGRQPEAHAAVGTLSSRLAHLLSDLAPGTARPITARLSH
jgi:hypothetical protein